MSIVSGRLSLHPTSNALLVKRELTADAAAAPAAAKRQRRQGDERNVISLVSSDEEINSPRMPPLSPVVSPAMPQLPGKLNEPQTDQHTMQTDTIVSRSPLSPPPPPPPPPPLPPLLLPPPPSTTEFPLDSVSGATPQRQKIRFRNGANHLAALRNGARTIQQTETITQPQPPPSLILTSVVRNPRSNIIATPPAAAAAAADVSVPASFEDVDVKTASHTQVRTHIALTAETTPTIIPPQPISNAHSLPNLLETSDAADTACALCGRNVGELIYCDSRLMDSQTKCPRAYHHACLTPQDKSTKPPWTCPAHSCLVCGAAATIFCLTCRNSWCAACTPLTAVPFAETAEAFRKSFDRERRAYLNDANIVRRLAICKKCKIQPQTLFANEDEKLQQRMAIRRNNRQKRIKLAKEMNGAEDKAAALQPIIKPPQPTPAATPMEHAPAVALADYDAALTVSAIAAQQSISDLHQKRNEIIRKRKKLLRALNKTAEKLREVDTKIASARERAHSSNAADADGLPKNDDDTASAGIVPPAPQTLAVAFQRIEMIERAIKRIVQHNGIQHIMDEAQNVLRNTK